MLLDHATWSCYSIMLLDHVAWSCYSSSYGTDRALTDQYTLASLCRKLSPAWLNKDAEELDPRIGIHCYLAVEVHSSLRRTKNPKRALEESTGVKRVYISICTFGKYCGVIAFFVVWFHVKPAKLSPRRCIIAGCGTCWNYDDSKRISVHFAFLYDVNVGITIAFC